MSLLPKYAFVYSFAWAFAVYGLRWAAFAAAAFFAADPSRARPLGRPHAERPAGFRLAPHVKREIVHSLLSLAIFALVNAVLIGYGFIRDSRMYFKLSAYPMWWFWASIPAMVLLHDTFFYWLHRAMHTRLLFARLHRLHHESLHPTAFAAYSFSAGEALAEALIATAIIWVIPVHPLAYLIFQTFSTAYNVYGHCGREFWPRAMPGHWLGRWVNTSTLHAHHHRRGRGNYSFYFTFWDRLMGTLECPASQPSRE